jgi:hypothetical protein
VALKIKPTPLLKGKSAQRFQQLINLSNLQKESHEQIKAYKVLAKKFLAKAKSNSTF